MGKVFPESLFFRSSLGALSEEQAPCSQTRELPVETNKQKSQMLNSSFLSRFLSFLLFSELHVIIGLSLDIFGSTICGYWCTRVIQIILTDIFSNTLTNVVLCFSLVYMTFYLGKAIECKVYEPRFCPAPYSGCVFTTSASLLQAPFCLVSTPLCRL